MKWIILSNLSLLVCQTLANSTCVSPMGHACGKLSDCSFNSSSYGQVESGSGYLELYNLCHSSYYGSIEPKVLGNNWKQISIAVLAEYRNDLLLDFFDSYQNLLFVVAFGTYSGTTAEVLSGNYSPLYQHCQAAPNESLQSNIVALDYLDDYQIEVKMYFESNQVGCFTVNSSLPYYFQFTCWNTLVTITSISIEGLPTKSPTSEYFLIDTKQLMEAQQIGFWGIITSATLACIISCLVILNIRQGKRRLRLQQTEASNQQSTAVNPILRREQETTVNRYKKKAVLPYIRVYDDELTVAENEEVEILETYSQVYFKCKNLTGAVGLVPKFCFELTGYV